MGEYTPKVIVEFDCLLDIEFGLVRLIRDKFNMKKKNGVYRFPQEVIQANTYFLRCLIYDRYIMDTVALIFNTTEVEEDIRESTIEFINKLFEDDKYYREILNRSPPTTILRLMEVFMKAEGVAKVTILCKNAIEEQFIKEISPTLATRVGQYDYMISQYDVIYINQYKDILKYNINNPIQGKEIIFPNYRFNMDPEDHTIPIAEVSALIAATNKIKSICPYKDFTLPEDES